MQKETQAPNSKKLGELVDDNIGFVVESATVSYILVLISLAFYCLGLHHYKFDTIYWWNYTAIASYIFFGFLSLLLLGSSLFSESKSADLFLVSLFLCTPEIFISLFFTKNPGLLENAIFISVAIGFYSIIYRIKEEKRLKVLLRQNKPMLTNIGKVVINVIINLIQKH